ncbi:MAG: Zn-ribbon domain-containing OB-fold protein, partial [Bacteroidetes bacterium]|nr:Zn-ribbon domain-containing OB-fold protein [Bacteroidota bacterium]
GYRCKEWIALLYPIIRKCTKCESNELEELKFKGTGEIYSYSTIYYPPEGFEKQVPYTIAIVKLDEGPKMTAQIVDFNDIEIGTKVESCIRKVYVDGDSGIIQIPELHQ